MLPDVPHENPFTNPTGDFGICGMLRVAGLRFCCEQPANANKMNTIAGKVKNSFFILPPFSIISYHTL
jgi:hypothetical protein